MKLIYRTALIALAYSHGIVPTVTIKRDGGAVRINEDDFDPETMELFDEPEQQPDPVAVNTTTDEPEQQPDPVAVNTTTDEPPLELLVMKSGGKFFISDKLGNKIEGEQAEALGITATGYTTEAKAQTALAEITKQA